MKLEDKSPEGKEEGKVQRLQYKRKKKEEMQEEAAQDG